MQATLFHDTDCALGEGPLWANNRLFFFDIPGKRLHAVDAAGSAHESWEMGCFATAAGKLANGKLLIATEYALEAFDPATGTRDKIVDLEAGNTVTRSNDGRADRQGGFWIGTMGKSAEEGAGSIYRFYKGELRKLRGEVTIPNAISFSPDGKTAYFADSTKRQVYTWQLDSDGWPIGEPVPFFSPENGVPDGAVVDSEGALIVALWNGRRVIRVTPEGNVTHEIALEADRPTCPAFGPNGQLFITTAQEGLTSDEKANQPHAGGIFAAKAPVPGIEEPVVLLS